jgi:formiminoglutamate deiminase
VVTDISTSAPDAVWVCDHAWLGGPDLSANVAIECRDGTITSITVGGSRPTGAERLRGVVLPGLVNAHSHAFHRLLRGRTHRQGGDFWLWRDRMYQAAAMLTPESYERLATAVFVEMAMAGITSVGEFHYLHHEADGAPYQDANEMGHAMVRAARAAGLRLGLLDAGYFAAGLDGRPLDPVQERFHDPSPSAWLDRVDDLRGRYDPDRDVVVGLAPHSVRAVPESALREVAERRPGSVVHIHLSEQPAENAACLDATGATPTGLLERVGLLGADTTVVHATHLTPDDIESIGAASSVVCYCATTERDLADGIGPARELFEAGAALSAGTDSHAIIDMFEEARGLEMHARLSRGRRGNFAPQELLTAISTAGAKSLGFDSGGLRPGSPADFVVIGTDSPRLSGMTNEHGLDWIVFTATSSDVSDVFVSGRQIVSGGRHPAWEEARGSLFPGSPGQ